MFYKRVNSMSKSTEKQRKLDEVKFEHSDLVFPIQNHRQSLSFDCLDHWCVSELALVRSHAAACLEDIFWMLLNLSVFAKEVNLSNCAVFLK